MSIGLLPTIGAAAVLCTQLLAVAAVAVGEVVPRSLVSRSDLIYQAPAAQPAAGHPIGNGRMGTLVWTSPDALHFQVNRVDVFAVSKHHSALPQHGATDYCGTCAQITVTVGGGAFEAGDEFEQRLLLYDAEASTAGRGVRARCFASAVADVLVLEIVDDRPDPEPLRVTLSKWRPARVVTGGHVATLDLETRDQRALVVQSFREASYSCASAVAVGVVGGVAGVARPNDESCTLDLPARRGTAMVLISSAASRSPEADVSAQALRILAKASRHSYDELRRPHARWWSDFWKRSFVRATSPDGLAERMERARNLHLYLMASSSRGALPPKWNGSIFTTEGDARTWGAQFWVWTTEMAYFPLHAAGASDLADPFFEMYLQQLSDCEEAARQRWGSQGAFYGETMPFDGPVVLPDDVADEYREVYLGLRRTTELSDRARQLGQYEGSLYVLSAPGGLAAGRYTWISHVCSSGAELAVHAWWRYRYTGDVGWLADHAYPLLRGTAEFYRHLVEKGEDGRYHLQGTNVHEDFWGVGDSIMDLAAIRGTVPLAVRAAEILDVDAELRSEWRDFLVHLAPYPMGAEPESKALTGGVLADDVWAAGHLGEVDGQHNPEDVWLAPVFPFEDWTLETRDATTDRIVQRALDLAPRHASVLAGSPLNTAIRTPIAVARAGRGDDLPKLFAAYWAAFDPLPNGFSLFEGPNAHSVEHLGLLSTVLQEALLQSVSPRPGEPEIISVFPAWPAAWDADFSLHARGGFVVTAGMHDSRVASVEIASEGGETCRLRNPWGRPCLLGRAGAAARVVEGDVLTFPTTRGDRYAVRPQGG